MDPESVEKWKKAVEQVRHDKSILFFFLANHDVILDPANFCGFADIFVSVCDSAELSVVEYIHIALIQNLALFRIALSQVLFYVSKDDI